MSYPQVLQELEGQLMEKIKYRVVIEVQGPNSAPGEWELYETYMMALDWLEAQSAVVALAKSQGLRVRGTISVMNVPHEAIAV